MATVVKVGYGVCVGSWDRFQRYVIPHAGPHLLATSGHTDIAVAYNNILDSYRARDFDVVILQHDDLEITDPNGERKLVAAVSECSDVTLAGVAGGSARTGLGWWNVDPVGHQRTDSGMIDFGRLESDDVDLLEGSLLVFGRWAIGHLRFDTTFRGFHGYDEVAMQSHDRVVVVNVDTWHHTCFDFDTPESRSAWLRADEQFREKWSIT